MSRNHFQIPLKAQIHPPTPQKHPWTLQNSPRHPEHAHISPRKSLSYFQALIRQSERHLVCQGMSGRGGMHFVYGASPQHILLHFPIKLLHLPIKFASFPQQIASFPQQFASFPQQIASFPQHSFSLPQHILCHFAKHRVKVFFCDLFSFLPFLAVPRQLYKNFSLILPGFFAHVNWAAQLK